MRRWLSQPPPTNTTISDCGCCPTASPCGGWRPQFLGANVPSKELVNAVAALDADAVALGASTHFHRLQLAEYVQDLREAHPSVRVWVGGPAFAHDHDGWDDEQVLDPLAIPSPAEA